MTKLLSAYARSTGLQISTRGPNVKQTFYPVAYDRYITIQTGSAQAAKCYDLWPEVLRLILPVLNANRIAVLHLGAKDDSALEGVHDLRGKTSILQSNYLIGRTLLHVGNDSWLAHCAGWHFKPLVALYGSTDPGPHGPYWSDPAKTSLLVSHRWGGRPTYVANENPKAINTIPPEQVANEALRLLGINHTFTQQSRFWGLLYQHLILDLIPDAVPAPSFLPELPINVRLDYLHNEEILAAVLATGRRINIITKRPIVNANLLAAHRAQILSYNHELEARDADGAPCTQPSIEYIGTIKTLIQQHAFYTKEQDAKALADLRFAYLDTCFIEQTKDLTQADYLAATLAYLNREDTPQNRLALSSEASYTGANSGTLMFRSNKLLLANGSVYLTAAHLKAGQPIQSLADNVARVIDDSLQWRDLNHQTIWYQPPSNDTADITPSVSQPTDPLPA
jgi:hypothetical protein